MDPEQLTPYVEGKLVVDLGCGPAFADAGLLKRCGATRVIGVDKEPPRYVRHRADYITACFKDFAPPTEPWVAYVAWPANYPHSLVSVLSGQRGLAPFSIIYRGKCTDGTFCGDYEFWKYLSKRQVLAYLPRVQETMIVYGMALVKRYELPEESAGLDSERCYSFSELHYLPRGYWTEPDRDG